MELGGKSHMRLHRLSLNPAGRSMLSTHPLSSVLISPCSYLNMAATSPAEAGPSTAARAGASPPSTSNSEQFSFTCRCLNVQVKGQIANGEAEQEGEINSGSLQVWLAAGAEFVVSVTSSWLGDRICTELTRLEETPGICRARG